MSPGGSTSATSQGVLGLLFYQAQYQHDTVINYAAALDLKSVVKQMCTKSCRYHLFINSSHDIVEVSSALINIYQKRMQTHLPAK